jgi:putative hydrolase of the HAD superfamily
MDERLMQAHLRPMQPLPTGLKPSGRISGILKAVLFDVYGTLLISDSGDIGVSEAREIPATVLGELLERFRVSISPVRLAENLRRAVERRHSELRTRGIDYPEVEIDRIWEDVLGLPGGDRIRRFALEYELIVNPVYPMPHLEVLLETCRRRSLIAGMVSNAQFYTLEILEWFLGADLSKLGFHEDLLIFSYRQGCAKPSPELFETAAGRLAGMGIEPSAVLYVGNDMLKDIHPARSVGFQTALFAGDRRSLRLRREDPRCRPLTPDLVVTDLMQLAGHLSGCCKPSGFPSAPTL